MVWRHTVNTRIIRSMLNRIAMPDDYEDQTPEGNALATEAAMNTIRTADLLFDRIGRLLRPLNVSAAGGLVLGLLRDHGPMTPSQLGERLIVTRATVTGLLDSLEARGYVRRQPHATDRRSLVVELTPEGITTLQQVRTIIHARETAWMGAFSDAELRRYIDVLHRIQDAVAAED